MEPLALTDMDVYRLERERCSVEEIAAAMGISHQCAAATMQRARIIAARAMDRYQQGRMTMEAGHAQR